MTLREECERTAQKPIVRHTGCPQHNFGSRCGVCKAVADEIERVARAFAERVASQAYDAGGFHERNPAPFRTKALAIKNAIAAAERGE